MSGEWLTLNNGFSRLQEDGEGYSRSAPPELNVQSQMYSFQAAEYAREKVDELDSYLDERFDGGVEAFFIYGSTGEGTAVEGSSDVDIMVLLEYPDTEALDPITDMIGPFRIDDYVDHASEYFHEKNGDCFEPTLDPESALFDDVYGRLSGQEEDFQKGRSTSQLEEVDLVGAGNGNDLQKTYPDFMRTLWQGSITTSEYLPDEFRDLIFRGFDQITDEEGLRTDIDWDGRDVPYNYGPQPMDPKAGSRNGDKDPRARQLRRMAHTGEEEQEVASQLEEGEQATFDQFGGKSLKELQPEQKTFDAFE